MNTNSKVLFILYSVIMATFASAETWHCEQFGKQRIIEVSYPDSGEFVCEVHYRKGDSEQVLWYAQNDRGYCSEQAAAFVEKQRGWGWQCTSDKVPESATDTNPQTADNH